MHCKAHQIGNTAIEVGNHQADAAAKNAAEKEFDPSLLVLKSIPLPETPKYDVEDRKLIKTLRITIKRMDGLSLKLTGLSFHEL